MQLLQLQRQQEHLQLQCTEKLTQLKTSNIEEMGTSNNEEISDKHNSYQCALKEFLRLLCG